MLKFKFALNLIWQACICQTAKPSNYGSRALRHTFGTHKMCVRCGEKCEVLNQICLFVANKIKSRGRSSSSQKQNSFGDTFTRNIKRYSKGGITGIFSSKCTK